MTRFKKGDRVRYSRRGLDHLKPRNPDVEGVVAHQPLWDNQVSVGVLWDGYKTSTYFNVSFIEHVPPSSGSAEVAT